MVARAALDRHHAVVHRLGRRLGRLAVDGDRRDVGDLAEQVDQLPHDPHEVAGGHVLLGEHLLEPLPRRPGVGEGDERRVGRAGALEPGGLLVDLAARGSAGSIRCHRWRTRGDGNHGAGGGSGDRCS